MEHINDTDTKTTRQDKTNANFTELLAYHTAVARGNLKLSTSADITCTEADTYYKINGTNWTSAGLENFSALNTGVITYEGENTRNFVFAGASDLSSDAAAVVTYVLYKNGEAVAGSETPHTFAVQDNIENISIVGIIEDVENGDEFEIYVKSSDEGGVVSVETLSVIFS